MIELLSAVFGFFAPFATEVFKFFQRKQDNEHELNMMKLQMEAKNQEHMYRMEEISATADIKEAENIHKPLHSFGVQLLDAAKNYNLNGWALYPAFLLFVILDFVASFVRPGITYAAFAFYATVKWAQLEMAMQNNESWQSAVLQIWTSSDMSIVILVLSYWFGHRAAKAAFGGSANTAYKGG
jgi:hypothetical protein